MEEAMEVFIPLYHTPLLLTPVCLTLPRFWRTILIFHRMPFLHILLQDTMSLHILLLYIPLHRIPFLHTPFLLMVDIHTKDKCNFDAAILYGLTVVHFLYSIEWDSLCSWWNQFNNKQMVSVNWFEFWIIDTYTNSYLYFYLYLLYLDIYANTKLAR